MADAFDPVAKEAELRAESAAWDTSVPTAADPGDIPIVDVAAYFETGHRDALEAAGVALRKASERVGFYQLIGHGIAPSVTDSILAATRRFHALQLATKRSVLMDRPDWPLGGVGYLPIGERKLPRRDKGNRNEAFLLKSDRNVGFDENQWLAEHAVPGFRAAVENYARAISDLAHRLLPVYAVALELDPGFFTPAFEHPFWRLRLTHYPPAEPRLVDDAYGIAPHVDTTFFTLLLADGPGLAIFSHLRDEWIVAPEVPGAFVVNSGELLRQWSNDRFLSTRHFANNTAPTDRYAVPFFFNATADYAMACLPTCQGPDNPPRYPAISYLESQAVAQGE